MPSTVSVSPFLFFLDFLALCHLGGSPKFLENESEVLGE